MWSVEVRLHLIRASLKTNQISMINVVRIHAATRAAFAHLGFSLLVGLLAAVVVFGLWFPSPYRELAGGQQLFLIVVAVDVVCGPLLTAVLFNPLKPRRELVLDLSLVALVQLAALTYGLYTVAQARPVYLVYEVDRFQVLSMADVQPGALRPELGGLHVLSWTGPKTIGVREPRDPDEKLKSLELSLQGIEPSARPDWWQSYEQSKPNVLSRAQAVSVLRANQPGKVALIDQAVVQSGRAEADLRWVPMTSFKVMDWVAFVDGRTAEVRAFAHVDGF